MSSGAVIVRSIVRDLYAHEQAARLLASITIVFSIVPIAAPLAGALLVGGGGWQAVFWCLAAAAALLLAATGFGLAETAPAERRSMHPLALARTFASILRERRFVAPFLLILCSHIGILAWVSNSAFTLVSGLGVGVGAYSLMFAMVMLGQISGAWASRRFVQRLGIARLLRSGAALMLAGGAAAAALAWSGVAHWLAVVIPFFAFLFGTALIVPNATASALSPFPGDRGLGLLADRRDRLHRRRPRQLAARRGFRRQRAADGQRGGARRPGRLHLREAAAAWKNLMRS